MSAVRVEVGGINGISRFLTRVVVDVAVVMVTVTIVMIMMITIVKVLLIDFLCK